MTESKPSEWTVKCLAELGAYDELTGDFTQTRYYNPSGKLDFYREQLRAYRTVAQPELTSFIIDRIKEALSGN